jgi:hypothetical protein
LIQARGSFFTQTINFADSLDDVIRLFLNFSNIRFQQLNGIFDFLRASSDRFGLFRVLRAVVNYGQNLVGQRVESGADLLSCLPGLF